MMPIFCIPRIYILKGFYCISRCIINISADIRVNLYLSEVPCSGEFAFHILDFFLLQIYNQSLLRYRFLSIFYRDDISPLGVKMVLSFTILYLFENQSFVSDISKNEFNFSLISCRSFSLIIPSISKLTNNISNVGFLFCFLKYGASNYHNFFVGCANKFIGIKS